MFQVNELLRQEISKIILTELSDPRLHLLTVTGVKASTDLKHARVFFHVHGSAEARQSSREALQRARGRVRHLLGQRVRIKFIPELSFEYDDRLDYAEHISETLEHLKAERAAQSTEPEEDGCCTES